MRKQELVHLHALLYEVSRDVESRNRLPADALDPYRQTGVSPAAVHRSKDAHRETVLVLARALADLPEMDAPAAQPAP